MASDRDSPEAIANLEAFSEMRLAHCITAVGYGSLLRQWVTL